METDEAKGDVEINKEETTSDPNPKPKTKIKPNWKRIGIGIFAIVVIILIIVLILILTKTTPTQEMTNISYSIELADGTILDSGTKSFMPGTIASSLGFETDKLDQEIEIMQEGEDKTITLEPSDAFGEYDKELVFEYVRVEEIDRINEINRTDTLTTDEFIEIFKEQPEVDKIYTLQFSQWKYKVLEVTDTKVKLSIETKIGDEIASLGYFPAEVIGITEDKIKLKLLGVDSIIPTPNGDLYINFTENKITLTLTPEIGQEMELPNFPEAIVTDMNDTHIFLDANPEFAGQKITIKVTLHEKYIEKGSTTGSATKIQGAPTMQVFIMSYCPYGLQMLKGMLPVMEKFQDKANIELRFVSYTMHGQKEEDENYRMICIREEQYSKLIPYLKCYAGSGDYESCLTQIGTDESKLNSCMESKAESYFEEDKTLNDKYDVKGSPTTVIDGQVVEIWPRSPEDIKQKLCEAFSTKPSECSETLSTENPNPGFGWGTSNQGGQC
ncbi:MAG: hypothetical protein IB618_04250 [Candidatus Pacearchaeota archaeon]|nr:MAG: hypothetical protein IB618_04250 [Candidatus Pacearchaeota archaeon]